MRSVSSIGHVPEAVLEELARVRPRALGVWEVVAPHDVADADLVATGDLASPGVRRADPAVAVEVLAREHRELTACGGAILRAPWSRVAIMSRRHNMSAAQKLPASVTAMRSCGKRSNTPVSSMNHIGRDGEEDRLVAVHAHPARHLAVLLVRAGAGVAVQRELELLAHRPHRVVPVAGVRRVVTPSRRDDDAAGEALGMRTADLGDRAVEVVEDRRDDQAGAALRARPGRGRRPSGCTRGRRRGGARGSWSPPG